MIMDGYCLNKTVWNGIRDKKIGGICAGRFFLFILCRKEHAEEGTWRIPPFSPPPGQGSNVQYHMVKATVGVENGFPTVLMHTYNLQHQDFSFTMVQEIISFSFKLDDKSQVVKGLRITETLGNDWVCDSWAGSCTSRFLLWGWCTGCQICKIAGKSYF